MTCCDRHTEKVSENRADVQITHRKLDEDITRNRGVAPPTHLKAKFATVLYSYSYTQDTFSVQYGTVRVPSLDHLWLLRMGFGINLVLSSHLAQPQVAQAMYQWAWHLAVSFGEAKVLEGSFTQSEHDLANLRPPRCYLEATSSPRLAIMTLSIRIFLTPLTAITCPP